MHRKWYKLEAISDLIITRHSVTEGDHKTQDYIPGSVFVGICAQNGLSPEQVLNNKIRFSDALPYADDVLYYPIPLSVHKAKYPEDLEKQYFNGYFDLREYKEQQLEQVRNDYLDANGVTLLKVETGLATKTALDRENYGASKENKLFTYEFIHAGQTFAFHVDFDDDIPESIREKVDKALTDTVRIGRSRSAEFGAASIEEIKAHDDPSVLQDENFIVFYLSSDMAPFDNGSPVAQPNSGLFGMDHAVFCPDKSYIRTRTYSPWNRFYNCRMTQRFVWNRGSVIVFQKTDSSTVPVSFLMDLREKLNKGVGMHTNEGCGQVLVNPEFVVMCETLKIEKYDREQSKTPKPEEVSSTLISVLRKRVQDTKLSDESKALGKRLKNEWSDFLEGLVREQFDIPGKSQWAQIREIADRSRGNLQKFKDELKEFCGYAEESDSQGKQHRSVRHKLWVNRIRLKANQKPMSLIEKMLEDLEDAEIGKKEEQLPGYTVCAVSFAVKGISGSIDDATHEGKVTK